MYLHYLIIYRFLTLMFHKVVWQHMQGGVGFLITTLLQIYQGKIVNQLIFDRIMARSLWPHFLAHSVHFFIKYLTTIKN